MGKDKRLALVTGGARGVGRAIAERLARQNVRLVIADQRLEQAQQCVEALVAAGTDALALPVDV